MNNISDKSSNLDKYSNDFYSIIVWLYEIVFSYYYINTLPFRK